MKRNRDTTRIDVPRAHVEVALDRVRLLCHPSLRFVIAPEVLDQLMLSCYQQGLMDCDQVARARGWDNQPHPDAGRSIFTHRPEEPSNG